MVVNSNRYFHTMISLGLSSLSSCWHLRSYLHHTSHSKLKGKKFREKKIDMMNGQIFNLFSIISPTLAVFSLPQK